VIPDDQSAGRQRLPSMSDPARVVGETFRDSEPAFPDTPQAPPGAPNVVLVLLDDVGFGQPSTFGGPVAMPALDALAATGLRYNRFHTTAMCSPTRAALLSGRNHHLAASGGCPEFATGFAGYDSYWPAEAGSLAQVLRLNGYSTAALGKWHNTPEWEVGPSGPFDRWPTGLGFEHFYGFMGADCNQWEPTLYRNTTLVDPPATPEDGYHLDKDLADEAIDWVKQQRSVSPERPFFLYWAPGTAHAPLHAPTAWIERFRGKFEEGWDALRQETFDRQVAMGVVPPDAKLTARPEEIEPWNSLSPKRQKLFARYMETFAGAVAHFDAQFDRFLEMLQEIGERDNTLIVFIAGDNGPAAEGSPEGRFNKWAALNGLPEDIDEIMSRMDEIGGPTSYPNYPVGWAWAGSTPFQWFKLIASHLGGTRNGMVVSWPERIGEPGIREHFSHVVDIMPTILDAVGIAVPSEVYGVPQRELSGRSLMASVDGAEQVDTVPRRQYFEILGNRGIYEDGWMASTRHGQLPWEFFGENEPFDKDRWELYHLADDFSQSQNLAEKNGQRLEAMKRVWRLEAETNNVLPLDDRFVPRLSLDHKPYPGLGRERFVYHGRVLGVPEPQAPQVKGRSHSITVRLVHDRLDAGLLVSAGGRFAGYALFIVDGSLVYVHNVVGREVFEVVSTSLPIGDLELAMLFTTDEPVPGSGGTVELVCDGVRVGRQHLTSTVPYRYSYGETFNVGRDNGSPVSERYEVPFPYSGALRRVEIAILSGLGSDQLRAEAMQRDVIEREMQ